MEQRRHRPPNKLIHEPRHRPPPIHRAGILPTPTYHHTASVQQRQEGEPPAAQAAANEPTATKSRTPVTSQAGAAATLGVDAGVRLRNGAWWVEGLRSPAGGGAATPAGDGLELRIRERERRKQRQRQNSVESIESIERIERRPTRGGAGSATPSFDVTERVSVLLSGVRLKNKLPAHIQGAEKTKLAADGGGHHCAHDSKRAWNFWI